MFNHQHNSTRYKKNSYIEKKYFMRKSINFLAFIFLSLSGYGQTYNSPESLEFDYTNDRWLISNKSANNILARSSITGDLTIFATGISSPHGIEIANDTVYVCSGGSLVAFELATGNNVFTINLGGSFLNGITHDSTYLYITDFSAKNIYRFNRFTRDYTVYIAGLTKSPNGIIYDQLNNRCVFVNWGSNAPIMSFDIDSGIVSTITPTTLGNCDGIAIDGMGNFYVSSWNLNGISYFDNAFSAPPLTVVSGLTNPADIFYNVVSDTLGVANSGSLSNTTYHFFGSTTEIGSIRDKNFSFAAYPNPMNDHVVLSYELETPSNVTVSLSNLNGQGSITVFERMQSSGKYSFVLNRNEIAAGNYLLKISTDNHSGSQLLVLID